MANNVAMAIAPQEQVTIPTHSKEGDHNHEEMNFHLNKEQLKELKKENKRALQTDGKLGKKVGIFTETCQTLGLFCIFNPNVTHDDCILNR